MALTITHTFVSPAATLGDDNDPNTVSPTQWNANHTIAGSVAASEVTGGAALTKVDDTNVTLTLGGTPASALLVATSVTVGWTGTLAAGRLNANVVQGVTNDTNVTGSIAAQNLTLGWTGTLAAGRGGFGTDISAQSGVPLFASGVPTFTSTTGSLNFVRATSPTLVTPLLGTPTSGTLTNCTGLPISSGVSGLGTGVATFLATPSSANLASALTDETGSGNAVFSTSPTLVTPLLGTPTSGTLTNCTGLPVSSGISGLGTGVATFLATPSSANLASALTDETGTGVVVFSNQPIFSGQPQVNFANGSLHVSDTGTSFSFIDIVGGGGSGLRFGQEGSSGGTNLILGSNASDGVINVRDNKRLVIGTNNTAQVFIDNGGQVFTPNVTTTASAANAFIDNATTPANQLKRSTSSLAYKRDIKPIRQETALKILSKARPIRYRSKCVGDNPEWSFYGLGAEDVAKIDPRLVHYSDAKPESVQYDRFVSHLIIGWQAHEKRIAALEAELAQLKRN